jgi:hypothetical protein
MDWLAFEHDVLAVQANPESEWVETDWHDIKGIPDDAYNSLLVSMTMPGTFLPRSLQRFDRIVYVEGEGKQLPNVIESRVLTSLSAPGRMEKVPMFFDTDDDGVYDSTGFGPVAGTSFAAPLTAGVAALLEQWGKAGNKPQGHLVEKVVLMNSASKHLQDIAGVHWMDSPAATDTRESLDDEMGIGSLNALAAVRQYQPATRTDLGVRIGTNQGEVDTYSLGKLSRGSLVTAALVWDAPVSNDATGDERLYDADNFVRGTFQDLSLQLARVNPSSEDGADTVRISQADAETTEHIYFNVREDGEYLLAVKNLTGTRNERFALSWTAGSSDGLSFSVDGGHFTPTRLERGETKPNPAIGSEAGISAAKFPNDVAALGTLGPAYLPTEGEIFVSARDGTNMQRLSAALGTRSRVGPHNGPPEASTLLDETLKQRGVLGLTPLDNLNGLSWGRDGSLGRTSVLIFSVDPLAEGVASTEVHSEAAGGQAAGDLFLSPKFASFGQYETYELFDFARREKNRLYVDEDRLGLLGTIEDLKPFEDDLDAIEIDSILDYVDRDGNGLHDAPVFFTLDEYSSSLGKNDRTPDDIFVSIPVDKTSGFSLDPDLAPSFSIYASGITDIGLKPGDVIDALVLSDTSSRRVPDGILQSERDEALFSLAAGSPSLDPDGQPGSSDDRSPADVFYTKFNASFSLYAGHNDLGLLFADELDALDVNSVSPFVIPEPSAILLMIIGACYTGRLSRVRRDAS